MDRQTSCFYALLAVLMLLVSCTTQESTAPETQLAQLARVTGGDALSVSDMLDDELFQGSVASVTEKRLRVPLLEAVDALAKGQIGRASRLIRTAEEEADALMDQSPADYDTLISWSVIERYFEEAELL